MEAVREHDAHEWKTAVNEENFNTMFQVEQLWKRTERLVDSLEVTPSQEQAKTSSLEAINKGMDIVHERLKIIWFGDRDGWKVALHYLGDNLADRGQEEKDEEVERGGREGEGGG